MAHLDLVAGVHTASGFLKHLPAAAFTGTSLAHDEVAVSNCQKFVQLRYLGGKYWLMCLQQFVTKRHELRAGQTTCSLDYCLKLARSVLLIYIREDKKHLNQLTLRTNASSGHKFMSSQTSRTHALRLSLTSLGGLIDGNRSLRRPKNTACKRKGERFQFGIMHVTKRGCGCVSLRSAMQPTNICHLKRCPRGHQPGTALGVRKRRAAGSQQVGRSPSRVYAHLVTMNNFGRIEVS